MVRSLMMFVNCGASDDVVRKRMRDMRDES